MSVGFVLTIMVLTKEEEVFLLSSIISGYTELGVRMDRACAMLENITMSNLTGLHQVIKQSSYRREVPPYGISLMSTEGNNWAPEDRHHNRES